MTTTEYRGPRIHDLVTVEVSGHVVEMQARGGVAGVLVALDNGSEVWRPIDDVVKSERST